MAKTIPNGQTCLEKRGMEKRHELLQENLYNGKDKGSEYSSTHENATSEPDSVKGKGRNGAGHLHWKPYEESKRPKASPNEIWYKNFITTSENGLTIGGKNDICMRDKLALMSTYERNKNEYSATNEDALSDENSVLGKGTGIPLDTTNGGGGYDIAARKEQIQLNYYNGLDKGNEYSDEHVNAQSTPYAPEPYSMKGKSSGKGGHLDYMGYYGKPKENPNEINYSNFITFTDDKSTTIGNEADVQMRKELSLKRRYNYDNEYSDKSQDAMSDGNIIGKSTGLYLGTLDGGGGYDVEARAYHISRNGWRKDLEYSKPLVLAEYEIQTEFKVSTADDDVATQLMNTTRDAQERELKAQEKARKKAEKKARKEAKKANTVPDVATQPGGDNVKPAPVETTLSAQRNNLTQLVLEQSNKNYIPNIGNEMFMHEFGNQSRQDTLTWEYFARKYGYLPLE